MSFHKTTTRRNRYYNNRNPRTENREEKSTENTSQRFNTQNQSNENTSQKFNTQNQSNENTSQRFNTQNQSNNGNSFRNNGYRNDKRSFTPKFSQKDQRDYKSVYVPIKRFVEANLFMETDLPIRISPEIYSWLNIIQQDKEFKNFIYEIRLELVCDNVTIIKDSNFYKRLNHKELITYYEKLFKKPFFIRNSKDIINKISLNYSDYTDSLMCFYTEIKDFLSCALYVINLYISIYVGHMLKPIYVCHWLLVDSQFNYINRVFERFENFYKNELEQMKYNIITQRNIDIYVV